MGSGASLFTRPLVCLLTVFLEAFQRGACLLSEWRFDLLIYIECRLHVLDGAASLAKGRKGTQD